MDATKMTGPHALDHPRTVVQAGTWAVEGTRFKVYGLLADGRSLSPDGLAEGERFVRDTVPGAIAAEGQSNGLGFVIVHPGDLGQSTVAHWWVQGSVLCQRIQRRLYGSQAPMDTARRPVIACVWELELIHAEQRIWRDTMMGRVPDPEAYLATRAAAALV